MHQAYKNHTDTTMPGASSKIVHAPIHPGEALFEEFQNLFEISQYWLAATIGVPSRRINEIVPLVSA